MVIRATGGDQAAFCTLYGAYKDKLYRYALYRLGNPEDAEDAVSDCVVSAYRQMDKLKKPEAFSSWLFRILYCACNALIKAQMQQRKMVDINDIEGVLRTDMQQTVDKTELQQALDMLKEQEREIVLLSVISGLSSKEIAAITDLTPGAVRSKLSRSLKKMREFLE